MADGDPIVVCEENGDKLQLRRTEAGDVRLEWECLKGREQIDFSRESLPALALAVFSFMSYEERTAFITSMSHFVCGGG